MGKAIGLLARPSMVASFDAVRSPGSVVQSQASDSFPVALVLAAALMVIIKIHAHLRFAAVHLSIRLLLSASSTCQQVGVAEETYCRLRDEYGGPKDVGLRRTKMQCGASR